MSTKNYANTNTLKNVHVGNTYSGKKVYNFPSSLHESNTHTMCNPLTCSTGSQVRCDINLSERYCLNELLFEFEQKNLSATLSQTVENPFLLLAVSTGDCAVIKNGPKDFVFFHNVVHRLGHVVI